jgi:hypothetical protein
VEATLDEELVNVLLTVELLGREVGSTTLLGMPVEATEELN